MKNLRRFVPSLGFFILLGIAVAIYVGSLAMSDGDGSEEQQQHEQTR